MRRMRASISGGKPVFWLLVAAAAVGLFACGASSKPPSAVSTPAAKAGSEEGAKEVKAARSYLGDPIAVPGIELGGSSFLLAVAPESFHGSAPLESTKIYRMAGLESGASLAWRSVEGELTEREYVVDRVMSKTIVSVLEPNGMGRQAVFELEREGDRVEIKRGEEPTRYQRTASGGLSIRRPKGVVEEYGADGTCRITRDGQLEAEGSLKAEGSGMEYLERSSLARPGDEEGSYFVTAVKPGRLVIEYGRAEPIADLLVEGYATSLRGESGLEALAYIDAIVTEKIRITPILALAYLGKLPLP